MFSSVLQSGMASQIVQSQKELRKRREEPKDITAAFWKPETEVQQVGQYLNLMA